MVARGATVFAASSRPAASLCSLFSRLATAFAPVMIGFVVSDFLHVIFSPDANLDSSNRPNRRHGKSFLSYPPTESIPADAYEFCHFNGRVGRHFYNRIGLYYLSTKKLAPDERDLRQSIRAALKGIAFRVKFGASEGTRFAVSRTAALLSRYSAAFPHRVHRWPAVAQIRARAKGKPSFKP